MPQKTSGQKIIVVTGPTASGKSDLGIKIAKKFNGEIISADSRQIYKGLDIGTGKVLKDKTFPVPNSTYRNYFYSSGIRHYLIDVVSPKTQFTADDFKKLSQKAITDIQCRYKVPIIIGGTGFYIDILLNRRTVADVPPNKKLRKKLGKLEVEKLFARLTKLDPERARTVEPKNKRRLIRALEVVLTTNKLVSSQKPSVSTSTKSTNYAIAKFVDKSKLLWIGVKLPKKVLGKRIKERLEKRLRQGMIKEVISLRKQGISWKRLDNLGLEYRQVSLFLKNPKSQTSNHKQISNFHPKQAGLAKFDSAVKFQILNSSFKRSEYYKKLLREIIKYSKRQMTWFKRNRKIVWINNKKQAYLLVEKFLR